MPTVHALHVLVVDDNKDAANSLCTLLQIWGYDCRAAYDGLEGLEAARTYRPNCLILDIAMPRMDGYTLAQQVRQQPGLDQAKLVALTAYSDEQHARRVKDVGFDFYLVKPADPHELERILERLDEVVRLTSRTEELARQNAAIASETREMIKEVKADIQELKDEVKGIKEELHDSKEPSSHEQPPTS
jgi:CheY-like chemotaxis protein